MKSNGGGGITKRGDYSVSLTRLGKGGAGRIVYAVVCGEKRAIESKKKKLKERLFLLPHTPLISSMSHDRTIRKFCLKRTSTAEVGPNGGGGHLPSSQGRFGPSVFQLKRDRGRQFGWGRREEQSTFNREEKEKT